MRRLLCSLALVTATLAGCTPVEPPKLPPPAPADPTISTLTAADVAALTQKANMELDDLHAAAAAADEKRYFDHYTRNAVFLGTDAKERWDMNAFVAFAHPHFAAGKGWSYKSVRRSVTFLGDGSIAIFDEDLQNDRIGPTRGSGVLVRENGRYLVAQYNLTLTVPNERVSAVKAAAAGLPPEGPPKPPDLRQRYKAIYDEATRAAEANDFPKARALLSAVVPEAKTRPDDDLEFWLHNELTWIAWAEGDLTRALAEIDAARTTVEHASFVDAKKTELSLHEKWDRAYVLLDIAMKEPAATRAKALARANDAKADYDALAKKENDKDGAAVLETYFDLVQKKNKEALTAAKKVDLDKDSDVQDLYVLSRAYEASKEKESVDRATSRICAAKSYLMKPLIIAARKREGSAACPVGP